MTLRARLLDEHRLMLSVEDRGVGMAPETVAKLFHPFSQAEDSTTRKYGGTGLGLVIAKQLAELMGGELRVDSTLGQGTTMTVILPVERSDQRDRMPDIAGLSLFVLHNDPAHYHYVDEYFSYFGASVKLARDSEELTQWVEASAGEEIVILASATSEEVNALYADLSRRNSKTRFLCMEPDRSARMGLISPRRYVSPRYPWHGSDAVRGLAILAKRHAPAEEADPALAASAPPHSEGQVGKGRILLVEDNEVNRDVILTQLELLGYDAEAAGDGKAGLALWSSGRFNLVLTDCHMPEMDGFEMTQAIREREAASGGRRTPIIAVTANALRGEAERCLALGMDDYLTKPVRLDALGQKLDGWLPGKPDEPAHAGPVA